LPWILFNRLLKKDGIIAATLLVGSNSHVEVGRGVNHKIPWLKAQTKPDEFLKYKFWVRVYLALSFTALLYRFLSAIKIWQCCR
jgi:hypothetical protein